MLQYLCRLKKLIVEPYCSSFLKLFNMFWFDSKCLLLLIIVLGHAAVSGSGSQLACAKSKLKPYQQLNLSSCLSQLHPKKLQWQRPLRSFISQQQDCTGVIWLENILIEVTTIRSKWNECDIVNSQINVKSKYLISI